jgi:hypothetical protein
VGGRLDPGRGQRVGGPQLAGAQVQPRAFVVHAVEVAGELLQVHRHDGPDGRDGPVSEVAVELVRQLAVALPLPLPQQADAAPRRRLEPGLALVGGGVQAVAEQLQRRAGRGAVNGGRRHVGAVTRLHGGVEPPDRLVVPT